MVWTAGAVGPTAFPPQHGLPFQKLEFYVVDYLFETGVTEVIVGV